MTEISGSNMPAPAATTNVAASSGIVIQGKTLAQVAAMALAAAIGGGGMSFASQPADELRSLKVSVDTVALSVNEIGVELRHTRLDADKLEKRVVDLERRLLRCACESER